MLVLNRGVDESIAIGDEIVVTVLGFDGDRVKIGIQAPREIKILRGEIRDAVQEQIKIQQKMMQDSNDSAFSELRRVLAEETEKETDKPVESEEKALVPEENDPVYNK